MQVMEGVIIMKKGEIGLKTSGLIRAGLMGMDIRAYGVWMRRLNWSCFLSPVMNTRIYSFHQTADVNAERCYSRNYRICFELISTVDGFQLLK